MRRGVYLSLATACFMLLAGSSPAGADADIVAVDASPPLAEEDGGGFNPLWASGDLPHFQPEALPMMEPLPVRLDWREFDKVTPVKDQGNCGACYAFASLASAQSQLLIDGLPAFDFSENNLKECGWWQMSGSGIGSCNGGNHWMAANFLSVNGAALESCDPYVPANRACTDTCPYIKTLIGLRVLSHENVPPPELLKAYLYFYGPVFTAMCATGGGGWSQEFFEYDGSYTLYNTGDCNLDHAVLIIGWDDTLSHAGGQGAFIVQNSWGASWGGGCGYGTERGYFTIAYGSASIGSYSAQFNRWQDHDPYEVVLHHDEAGPFGRIGYADQSTAWGLCRFVPSEDLALERVEIWSYDRVADLDVYVYEDFDGIDAQGLLGSSLDNIFHEAGYHSVELPSPVPVLSGEDFHVVVKLTLDSQAWPLTYDRYSSLTPNSSYMSPDGSSGSWMLLTDVDLGIRVRATGLQGIAGVGEPEEAELWLRCSSGPAEPKVISYTTASHGYVALKVHDVRGRVIEILAECALPAGRHSTTWDLRDRRGARVAPGVYFVRLTCREGAVTEKTVVLR